MFGVEEAGCRGEEEHDEADDGGDDAKGARVGRLGSHADVSIDGRREFDVDDEGAYGVSDV
jgi:hypothetical protein